MRTPVILVNLKAYPEALGRKAVAFARMCAEVGEKTGASIAIAPAAPDLALVALEVLIPRCTKLGLEVVCCADDIAEAEAVARFFPDYVAIEPPELIGGDVSVTSAKPEVVAGAVERIRAVNPKVEVLCGAGVKSSKDVAKAIELGAVGVLLASGVVQAKDPRKVLMDLAKGLR